MSKPLAPSNRRAKGRALVAAAACALATLLAPPLAHARTSQDYMYGFDQVWNASARLIRVDMRCHITDRDQDAGFVLFDYVDGSRTYPGSVEFVHARVERRDGVRAVVQIPAMPSYVERMILDKLARKLLEDFGEPPPAPPPPAPPQHPPHGDQPPGHSPGPGAPNRRPGSGGEPDEPSEPTDPSEPSEPSQPGDHGEPPEHIAPED